MTTDPPTPSRHTAVGANPFATIEHLPDGDVLSVLVNRSAQYVSLLMQRYDTTLREAETVLHWCIRWQERVRKQMAIDAVIDHLAEEGRNLRLYLRPRTESDLSESIAGQSELVILDYTWKPQIGQEIWGGANSCVIEPLWGQGIPRWYDRTGYTKLRERDA